jgi:hypothetical protein
MLDDKATWQIRTEALECRASRIGLLSPHRWRMRCGVWGESGTEKSRIASNKRRLDSRVITLALESDRPHLTPKTSML